MNRILIRVLFIVAVLLIVCGAVPVSSHSKKRFLQFLQDARELESTPEEILPEKSKEITDSPIFHRQKEFSAAARFPTSRQAANISRSKLAYLPASDVPVSITIPKSRSINMTVNLSGSLHARGVFANDIEKKVENLAGNVSRQFKASFDKEREALQKRAGNKYFFFFQAAANFGYSDVDRTRRMIRSSEFEYFTNQSAIVISTQRERAMKSNYSVPVKIESVSYSRRVTLRALAYISKISMKSGREVYVIRNPSELIIADQFGNIYDDTMSVEFNDHNTVSSNLSSDSISNR